MGITINDPYTVNKITVSNSGTGPITGPITGTVSRSITYSEPEKPPVEIPILSGRPTYCLMAKTESPYLRKNWAEVMSRRGFRVFAWDETDDFSFSNFKRVDGNPSSFMCPSFIREVKFSYSERTGKTSTVVFFEDGTKEIATPADGEEFDAEEGINQCLLKRVLGNRSQLKKIYKQWIPGYQAKEKIERKKCCGNCLKETDIWVKEERCDAWDS